MSRIVDQLQYLDEFMDKLDKLRCLLIELSSENYHMKHLLYNEDIVKCITCGAWKNKKAMMCNPINMDWECWSHSTEDEPVRDESVMW